MIRLNASALPRVLACLGSTQFPETNDIEQSESAREGTAAHFAAEYFIRERSFQGMPDSAPNGHAIDAEMREQAQAYAETIPSTAGDGVNAFRPHLEQRSDWLATSTIEIAVRIDAWWIADDTLHVRDYKYGWRLVDPEGNAQLLAGAIGVLRNHFGKQSLFPPTRINMGIYQPRPYHPDGALRTWEVSLDELIAAHDALVGDLSRLPSDVLQTGEHCEHCPGAIMGTCPAYLAAAGNAIDVATRGGPMEVTPAQMARELVNLERAAKVIEQRHDWLKDSAKRAIKAGQVVPGWALETALGNTAWTIDAAALKQLTNVDVLQPEKLVSPAEAKRRGVSEDVIKENTKRPNIGERLVRRDPDAYVRKKVSKPRAKKS